MSIINGADIYKYIMILHLQSRKKASLIHRCVVCVCVCVCVCLCVFCQLCNVRKHVVLYIHSPQAILALLTIILQ